MSAYNAENFISDSIRSILGQTYDNWELIILDDHSSDSTFQIVEGFSDINSRIKLIQNKENLGPYVSANIGLKHAKGEFIARLDADDISESLRLEKEVDFLNNNEGVSLVGSGAYLINESGAKVKRIHVISKDRCIRKLIMRVNPFIHSSIMLRKKELENVQGYSEKLRYSGDYDLYLRLIDNDRVLANISDPLVCWRVSVNGVTMQHHNLQRIYADIARELSFERKEKGYDSYESMNVDKKIDEMLKNNYWRYQCEYGAYQAIFMKQFKRGLFEVLNGIARGGFPYNALMQVGVQLLARV